MPLLRKQGKIFTPISTINVRYLTAKNKTFTFKCVESEHLFVYTVGMGAIRYYRSELRGYQVKVKDTKTHVLPEDD